MAWTLDVPTRPDYTTARQRAGFGGSAFAAQGALREVTRTPIREFNLEPGACIDAYRRGRPLLRELFGEQVGLPAPCTPAVSYGHANALGSELLFPEGGEVAHTHVWGSLEEGLRRLAQPVDYAETGWAPFYLRFRETMREAFPGEVVGFGYGAEGPITTAYELRGDGFYTDIYDQPELAVEFLARLTDSIVDFCRWSALLDGRAFPNPNGGGMCDDCAAFIPPNRFAELVLPAWDRYYRGTTTGPRSAHVEDLRPAQLPFLEDIGLHSFDPSISGRLTPALVAGHCRVPFAWRLPAFHCVHMSVAEVESFVYAAAAAGASSVFVVVEEILCNEADADKVRALVRTVAEVKRLLADGMPREELAERVSSSQPGA